MQTTEFSEFTFGYALTRDIETRLAGMITAVPCFPSLIEEGGAGGGYDVEIQTPIAPVFVQFKIPQVVTRLNHKDVTQDGYQLPVPFYRMHLRTKPSANQTSSQHELLLQLANNYDHVYYATPGFDSSVELVQRYRQSAVLSRSAFFRPRGLGVLDRNPHHVSYEVTRNRAWLFSTPQPVEFLLGSAVVDHLRRVASAQRGIQSEVDFAQELAERLLRIAREHVRHEGGLVFPNVIPVMPGRVPWRAIARLACICSDTQLLILHTRRPAAS